MNKLSAFFVALAVVSAVWVFHLNKNPVASPTGATGPLVYINGIQLNPRERLSMEPEVAGLIEPTPIPHE